MHRMRPEIAQKWADALRSGKYQQGQGDLSHVNYMSGGRYFCCLGVLCEVAVEEGVIPPPVSEGSTSSMVYGRDGDTAKALPPSEVVRWAFGVDPRPRENNTHYVNVGMHSGDHYNAGEFWSVEPGDYKFNPRHLTDGKDNEYFLSELNDTGAANFDTIADMVEYTHVPVVKA